MMVVGPVVVVVVLLIVRTFDKRVDTLVVVDMMTFDYRSHYRDYSWMMLMTMMLVAEEEDEMVLT